jgi:O-antigen ligase
MFFVGALFFSRQSLHDWSMIVFMVLAVVISGYAGVEWIMKKNILLQFIPSGKDFAEFQAALALSRLRDGFFRAQSTFEHPLLLAEFSAMAVCFGMAAMLWPHKSRAFRVFGGVTLISAIAAAFFTGSRSALITVAAGGGMVIMLWIFAPKQPITSSKPTFRKISFMMTLTAALAIALPAATLLSQGKSQSEITSTAARIQMLELGLPSIQEHPLLGTGPGTAGMVAGILTGSGVRTLDNYFLAITIESGVPALLLLLACLLYPIWIIFIRLINGVQDSPQYFAAILGCLIVTTLTHTVLWMPYNMFFTFILSGAALAAFSNMTKKNPNYSSTMSK